MGTVIRWGMGAAAIILFLSLLLSGSLLWYKYHDDCAGKKEYQLICKIAETQTAGDFSRLCFLPETSNLPVSAFTCPESRKLLFLPRIDEPSLRALNRDYAAWLYIPDTAVNYPVVYPKSNSDYLGKTFKKESHSCGCLFFESSFPPFSQPNTVIYGHNMRSGEMFGKLKEYLNDEYLEQHRKIYICRSSIWREYRIREVFLTKNSDMSPYQPDIGAGETRGENGTVFPVHSHILTLSTCHGKNQKLILQAELTEVIPPLLYGKRRNPCCERGEFMV